MEGGDHHFDNFATATTSVTKSGDLLDFGQLFKVFGNS